MAPRGSTFQPKLIAGTTRAGISMDFSSGSGLFSKLNFKNEFDIGGDARGIASQSVGYQFNINKLQFNTGLRAYETIFGAPQSAVMLTIEIRPSDIFKRGR